MAYDSTGATVGAAGHDAAAVLAAMLGGGFDGNVHDAYAEMTRSFADTLLAIQADLGASAPEPAKRGAPPRRATGQSAGNSAPGDLDFRTGKYAGQSIAAVYAEHPDYIEWCAAELKNEFMRDKCIAYIASVEA